MNPLDQADLDSDLQTSAATKLTQTVELMSSGLRLKRAALRQQHPDFDRAQLEQAFHAWLFAEDDL